MRVLLLSACDAHSHRRWREGLVAAFPEWEWTVLTLPPHCFSWRIRGNSLSWAFGERTLLEQPCDLLVTTRMTDLSNPCAGWSPPWRGCRPWFAATRTSLPIRRAGSSRGGSSP